uniref:Uncharacterized protein n=1 Tax=Pygocentrus nattereri TaxID=42514 RepID=A0A3B4BK63_PYGNA
MWIVPLLAALAAVCGGQQDCSRGACYPPLGDLLIGRERQLSASSTCGLTGIEVYCTPFGQFKMKCCPCDSRNPAGLNAHTIQNILPNATPDRWWQSKKDVSPVTLQLDLQQMFHGPRPDALVIERTKDYGRTWQPALYMATDCPSSFPQVTTAAPRNLDNTYCYTLPTTSPNPYQDQRVTPSYTLVYGFTGLRVKLTQLGDVPRLPGRSPSRFYALKELKVTGSCFCHGHANRCILGLESNYLPTAQVNGVCECQHNTAGLNCEHCAEFYNDLPWRPAERDNPHTCKRCECNNHAERCHFDRELYEQSGRRSGGVCDGCLHNTAGLHCEHCATNYYRNPNSNMQRPDACLPCQCDSAGSGSGRQCDPVTGLCVCKANVEGSRCDRCKVGYYGLSSADPLGCSQCSCSATGSLSSVCDAVTGQCACRPNAQGVSCDRCAPGFWASPSGCQPCDCDPSNSLSSTCDQQTGQCPCRSGFTGRTCGGCPDSFYGNALTGCRPCQCDSVGTVLGGCDKRTGACRCKPGAVGSRCDACARGHCADFPQCSLCPSCFFSLDIQLQNLTYVMDHLAGRIGPETGPVTPNNLPGRIRLLENTLQEIRSLLQLPLRSNSQLNEDLDKLSALRSVTPHTLNPAHIHLTPNAYNRSVQAEKRADATAETIHESVGIRYDITKGLDNVQPANTKNLQTLGEDLATRPNLTPTAVQVCGSNRTAPCTPAECKGELCPAGAVPPCGQSELCTGALPQAVRATQDADEVKTKLQQLNDNITKTYTEIQQTQDSASRVRLRHLVDKQFITILLLLLLIIIIVIIIIVTIILCACVDPSSDPAEVQRVCEAVLGVKLPEGAESLRRKLQELQDLASTLPDSSKVLKEAEPKLEQARRLLQDAEKTR